MSQTVKRLKGNHLVGSLMRKKYLMRFCRFSLCGKLYSNYWRVSIQYGKKVAKSKNWIGLLKWFV